MNDLPASVFSIGNIVGLGESSHGSKTEFEWKYNLILETIKGDPEAHFVCYLEAYEDPLAELVAESMKSAESLEQLVSRCLKKMYSLWQTRETYTFLLDLVRLIVLEGREIKVIGIDFRNKEHKQSFNVQKMLEIRDTYMFGNIKKSYQTTALHFVIAHNAHIGRYNDNGKSFGNCLVQEFTNQYIPIAQHVSSGTIRAKYNNGDYQSVDFVHDNTPESITSFSHMLFRQQNTAQAAIFDTSDPQLKDVRYIQQAGFFWPLQEPWIMPFGAQYFDYVILHPKSESAEPLFDNE